jgi:hypothetical protein
MDEAVQASDAQILPPKSPEIASRKNLPLFMDTPLTWLNDRRPDLRPESSRACSGLIPHEYHLTGIQTDGHRKL